MPHIEILEKKFEFSPKIGVRSLPDIDQNHQSNRQGIYVVGDLADAPIIKVALQQGFDVAQHVCTNLKHRKSFDIDIAIIGAGPAGIGASLACKEHQKLKHAIIERNRPFHTIQNFPKGKEIFAEPKHINTPKHFWFSDTAKEDLIARWDRELETKKLPIIQPLELLEIQDHEDGFCLKCKIGVGGTDTPLIGRKEGEICYITSRRVILATGKRGQYRKLKVFGEDLPHVSYHLKDPKKFNDSEIVVVGGGDTALETAIALAKEGNFVHLCHRQAQFEKAHPKNIKRIKELELRSDIQIHFQSEVTRITPKEVILNHEKKDPISCDHVFVHIGTELPNKWLKKQGIRQKGELYLTKVLGIMLFIGTVFLFYSLKHKYHFYPFGSDDVLHFLPSLLDINLGFRSVDASFFGTCIYSLIILFFGIRCLKKYPSPEQQFKYKSLIGFQWIFLFGIPEIIAPLFIDRPWKLYSLSVPWPLSIWSVIDAPSWTGGNWVSATLWILAGLGITFVAIPIYVKKHGLRFCSYLCGCGGLAETLGDAWRELAPRGQTAKKMESLGRIVLFLSIPVTLLILNDAWQFFATDALYNSKVFAQKWYTLMVDFWLASILGVALYPILGNRFWCRFFCPLRAYMEILAKQTSTLEISSNERCIGCGECTRYCQMGIPVQKFAQLQIQLNNQNSSCIQCGICIEVCPMDVLKIGKAGEAVKIQNLSF